MQIKQSESYLASEDESQRLSYGRRRDSARVDSAREFYNDFYSVNNEEEKVSKSFTKTQLVYEGAVRGALFIIILVTQFIPAHHGWVIQLGDMKDYAYPIRHSLGFLLMMSISLVLCGVVLVPSIILYQKRIENRSTSQIEASNGHKIYGINRYLLKQELIAYTLALSLAILGNMAFANVIKIIAGVPRPDYINRCFPSKYEESMNKLHKPYIPETLDLQCEQNYGSHIDPFNVESRKSFPSGHSAMIVAMTFVVNWYIWNRVCSTEVYGPGIKIIGYFLGYLPALIITSGRIRAHRHHATDVFAGVVIGIAAGYISIRAYFHRLNCKPVVTKQSLLSEALLEDYFDSQVVVGVNF